MYIDGFDGFGFDDLYSPAAGFGLDFRPRSARAGNQYVTRGVVRTDRLQRTARNFSRPGAALNPGTRVVLDPTRQNQ